MEIVRFVRQFSYYCCYGDCCAACDVEWAVEAEGPLFGDEGTDQRGAAPFFECMQELTELEPECQDTGQFQVDVCRDLGGIGLEFEQVKDSLLIAKVTPGPVKHWNEDHNDELHLIVMPGDEVISVNDRSGSSHDLLLSLSKGDHFCIKLRHPRSYQVKLEKHGRPLGISLLSGEDKLDQLKVKTIGAGAADAWNKSNPERVIRNGDRIIEVNGISGDSGAMLKELKEQQFLCMTFIQPV